MKLWVSLFLLMSSALAEDGLFTCRVSGSAFDQKSEQNLQSLESSLNCKSGLGNHTQVFPSRAKKQYCECYKIQSYGDNVREDFVASLKTTEGKKALEETQIAFAKSTWKKILSALGSSSFMEKLLNSTEGNFNRNSFCRAPPLDVFKKKFPCSRKLKNHLQLAKQLKLKGNDLVQSLYAKVQENFNKSEMAADLSPEGLCSSEAENNPQDLLPLINNHLSHKIIKKTLGQKFIANKQDLLKIFADLKSQGQAFSPLSLLEERIPAISLGDLELNVKDLSRFHPLFPSFDSLEEDENGRLLIENFFENMPENPNSFDRYIQKFYQETALVNIKKRLEKQCDVQPYMEVLCEALEGMPSSVGLLEGFLDEHVDEEPYIRYSYCQKTKNADLSKKPLKDFNQSFLTSHYPTPLTENGCPNIAAMKFKGVSKKLTQTSPKMAFLGDGDYTHSALGANSSPSNSNTGVTITSSPSSTTPSTSYASYSYPSSSSSDYPSLDDYSSFETTSSLISQLEQESGLEPPANFSAIFNNPFAKEEDWKSTEEYLNKLDEKAQNGEIDQGVLISILNKLKANAEAAKLKASKPVVAKLDLPEQESAVTVKDQKVSSTPALSVTSNQANNTISRGLASFDSSVINTSQATNLQPAIKAPNEVTADATSAARIGTEAQKRIAAAQGREASAPLTLTSSSVNPAPIEGSTLSDRSSQKALGSNVAQLEFTTYPLPQNSNFTDPNQVFQWVLEQKDGLTANTIIFQENSKPSLEVKLTPDEAGEIIRIDIKNIESPNSKAKTYVKEGDHFVARVRGLDLILDQIENMKKSFALK